jgi:hypothetical protein
MSQIPDPAKPYSIAKIGIRKFASQSDYEANKPFEVVEIEEVHPLLHSEPVIVDRSTSTEQPEHKD